MELLTTLAGAKILPFFRKPHSLPENSQKVTDKDVMLFLANRLVEFIRIPYDSETTTYVFGYRNAGAIEAVVIRKGGKATICFTDRKEEVELNDINELNKYNPFILQLKTLCIS